MAWLSCNTHKWNRDQMNRMRNRLNTFKHQNKIQISVRSIVWQSKKKWWTQIVKWSYLSNFPLSNVAWLPTNCNPSLVFLVSSSLVLCFALNLSKAQPLKEIESSLLLMSHVRSLFHGLTLTFLSKNFLLSPKTLSLSSL